MPKNRWSRRPKKPKEDKFYNVELILDKKIDAEKGEIYQIKWEGYKRTSWVSKECLSLCQDYLEEFEMEYAARGQVPPRSQKPQPSGSHQPGPAPSSRNPQPGPALLTGFPSPRPAPPLGSSKPGPAPSSRNPQPGPALSTGFPSPRPAPPSRFTGPALPPGFHQLGPVPPSAFPQPGPAPTSGFLQPGPATPPPTPPIFAQSLPVLAAPPTPPRRQSLRNRLKAVLPRKFRLIDRIQKRKNSKTKALSRPNWPPIFYKMYHVLPSHKLRKIVGMNVKRAGIVRYFMCIMTNKERLLINMDMAMKHWPKIVMEYLEKRHKIIMD